MLGESVDVLRGGENKASVDATPPATMVTVASPHQPPNTSKSEALHTRATQARHMDPEPEIVPTPPWANQWAFARQLHRTTLCYFQMRYGCCRDGCTFAHAPAELRAKPLLRKTAMCQDWKQGRCNNGAACDYAHGVDDLRAAGLYKTQLCNFHARGYCRKGNLCRHAHGKAELRQPGDDNPRGGTWNELPLRVCSTTEL